MRAVVVAILSLASVSERFIHGEIYRARADVPAVMHNHSPGR